MKKIIFYCFVLTGSIACFAASPKKNLSSQYGFIENKGQIIDQNNKLNPAVLYLYNGFGMNVQLKQTGFSYEAIKIIPGLPTTSPKSPKMSPATNSQLYPLKHSEGRQPEIPVADSIQVHRIDISFLNCNKQASLISSEPAKDYINYYTTGTHVSDVPVEQAGVTNVHHYQKVLYQNIYPNIDVEFLLNLPTGQAGDKKQKGAFKYNFIIHPGGNMNDIQLKFEGANTSLSNEGNIIIETAFGNIEESIPLSYQIGEDGSQQNITANFVKLTTSTFGLKAKNFDPKAILVIDPTPWATYYGGSGADYGNGIASDSIGNIVVIGYTSSSSAIATSGSYQSIFGGSSYDAYIVKFNPSGIRQWATYYGGTSIDKGMDVDISTNSEIFVVGITGSLGLATTGAYLTSGGNSFILNLNASGIRQWCTYYAGEFPASIEVDYLGNVIIVGSTAISSGIATIGAHQATLSLCGACLTSDGFIAKINSLGTTLLWGTYYGSTLEDYLFGLAIDNTGNIFVTGNTISVNSISTTGSHQFSNAGYTDGFLVKFNSSGVRQWGTYYGGGGDDYGYDIVVDSGGNCIITGVTYSTSGISSSGTFQPSNGGGADAFVAKFNSSGVRQWGTYYGGNNFDSGAGICLDSTGNILITGYTTTTSGISSVGAFQMTNAGGNDAYLTKFNSAGGRIWSTYYGGSGSDKGNKCACNLEGNIYLTGITTSLSGIATSGSYQSTYGGGTDAMIASITFGGALPIKLISFDATPLKENEIQKVDCRWSTASELNNNYFTIERSQDLENFEGIGNVKGAGNSSKLLHYQYRDEDPFAKAANSSNLADKLYYRLRQTDFDGSSTLSEIKAVEFNNTSHENIKLVYDKEHSLLQINSIATQKVSLQLFDLNGQQLWSVTENTGEGLNTIPVQANVAQGFYLLKVELGDQVQNFKVWMK